MTEEQQQPTPEPPSGTEPPPTVPVGSAAESTRTSEDTRTSDEIPRHEEPYDAKRTSPYAIAAFAVAVVSLFTSPQIGFLTLGDGVPLLRGAFAALPTLASAVIALWLAGQGDREIYISDGELGGVGFCRAARIVAVTVVIFVVVAIFLAIVARTPGPPGFGL